MTLSAPVLKTLLMAASLGMVVPMLAQPSPPARARVTTGKEPEVEPALPGVVVPRGEGWMSLSVNGGTFRLGFHGADKKPIASPASRATARWNPPLKTGEVRAVLNPTGDGLTLQANKQVRPPLVFKVYLTLLDAEGATLESHVVDFKG